MSWLRVLFLILFEGLQCELVIQCNNKFNGIKNISPFKGISSLRFEN